MSILNNINGVWRDANDTLVNINGVWRSSQVYSNINGVWRFNNPTEIKSEDILGFKLIYQPAISLKHEEFPNLEYNHKLPARLFLTGETPSNMDFSLKGVRFHYSRQRVDQEGNKVYKGTLYAMMLNDAAFDVGNVSYNTSGEIGLYNKNADELVIQINGYHSYQSNGLYFSGWNSLFTKDQLVPDFKYPDKDEDEINNIQNRYILPITSRSEDFNPVALIGIARSLHDEINMVGSLGILDHAISSITVNGRPKPFTIEIYE